MAKKRPPRPGPEATQEEIAGYLDYSFEHDDAQQIRLAVGDVVKLFDIPDIARIAGIRRESVYRAFWVDKGISFPTILKVLAAMGLGLGVRQMQNATEAARRKTR